MFQLALSDTKNPDTQRKRINRLLALYGPSYGSALPDPLDKPDGALFYIGAQGYQLREGAWVAL